MDGDGATVASGMATDTAGTAPATAATMTAATTMSTPLRTLGTRTADGYLLVRDPGSNYRDGGEQRVREIVDAAAELASSTDGLVREARSWPERYHLDPARANVLRALDLAPTARVLEVGAGCGAITRYLGETCALVDALEPVPARAAATRARCRDLANVEVVVAAVDDVPASAVYDVVVVVGVLEYVGAGSGDDVPYLDFLATLARLLAAGGTLVVAIENKLGVKYLCGAPEDHSGRPYDSVEGYPFGAPARTFSRAELSALLSDSGMASRSLIAFPDYKLTRAVFDPDVLHPPERSLLYRIPTFPSPDYLADRAPGAAEAKLWRSLVQAGLAAETGNSFVVLATANSTQGRGRAGGRHSADRDDEPGRDAGDASTAGAEAAGGLWPADRAGVYFAENRPERYAVRTEITCAAGNVAMTRSFVRPDADRRNEMGLTLHPEPMDYVPGVDAIDVLVGADDPTTVDVLRRWAELVVASCRRGQPAPLELIPRNLILTTNGGLVAIDQEWSSAGGDSTTILQRGAMITAVHLLFSGRLAGTWRTCSTVEDVARAIGAIVGPDWPASWLDRAIVAEGAFQAEASIITAVPERDAQRRWAADVYRTALAQTLPGPTASRLADSDPAGSAEAARIAELSRELADARRQAAAGAAGHRQTADRADAEAARAERALTELSRVRASLSWRVTAPLRWVRGQLPSPRGAERRRTGPGG